MRPCHKVRALESLGVVASILTVTFVASFVARRGQGADDHDPTTAGPRSAAGVKAVP